MKIKSFDMSVLISFVSSRILLFTSFSRAGMIFSRKSLLERAVYLSSAGHRGNTSLSITSSPSDDVLLDGKSNICLDHGDDNVNAIKKQGLHTVMVHRNKQSLAFREGAQLVFSKSIASTFTEALNCDDDRHIDEGHDIPFGSLVAVVVSGDSSDSGTSVPKKRNKNSTKTVDKEFSSYSHIMLSNNDEGSHRDAIHKSQLIGYGFYNPFSMYRVRIVLHETTHPDLTKEIRSIRKKNQIGNDADTSMDLILSEEERVVQRILKRRILDAIYLRLGLNLPLPGVTDTYRLVNGEGDGLSGLAVDVIGGTAVIVMSSAAWCEIHKESVLVVLKEALENHQCYKDLKVDIIWRTTPARLIQDGYEINDNETTGNDASVVATECSVKYVAYPYSKGQKTGFYCDQRENRLMIANFCDNKRILDLCCYNGGFALNAMIRGNAASAIGVDSSQDAVDSAIANAKVNGLTDSDIFFVRDDIAIFMKKEMQSTSNEYDVIILDPPKLAPSVSSLPKASRKYHSLNRDAINLINKSQGGLLLTCTCSAAMTQQDGGRYFLEMVNSAALSAKRQATLLSVTGAAPCHTQSPVSFPAGNYLTCALFFISPAN